MAEKEKKAVVEEVKNCPSCNKPLKRSRRFYRNGKYYCNNTCFKTADVKAKAAQAAAAAPKE